MTIQTPIESSGAVPVDGVDEVQEHFEEAVEAAVEEFVPAVVTTVSRSALAAAVTAITRVVEKRNYIPILGNVKIACSEPGLLTVTGADLDVYMHATVPAIVDSHFAITVPAHMLRDVLKKAKACESVSMRTEKEAVKLDFAGLNVTMKTMPVTDFPSMNPGAEPFEFSLAAADLLRVLSRVQLAISTEETRYYLCGVYMHVVRGDALAFVATDGHRLGKVQMPCPAGFELAPGVIIPRNTVVELINLCKAKGAPERVTVRVSNKVAVTEVDEYDGVERTSYEDANATLQFIVGSVTLDSKTIDGTYPDYARVIPTGNDKRMEVDRKAMIEAVNQVCVMHIERSRPVKLSVESSRLRLSVENFDAGTADMELPCEYDGQMGMDAGFNASYVTSILEHLESDTVVFKLADPRSPTLIEGKNDGGNDYGVMYVLMPMRV